VLPSCFSVEGHVYLTESSTNVKIRCFAVEGSQNGTQCHYGERLVFPHNSDFLVSFTLSLHCVAGDRATGTNFIMFGLLPGKILYSQHFGFGKDYGP
jgi:hypothetical protein